jgi:hypothetical protein
MKALSLRRLGRAALVRAAATMLAGLAGAAAPARAVALDQQAPEYEVKAAFLYNFVNFVTWPAAAVSKPSDALTLCVFGSDPFGSLLDRTIEGAVVGDRPLTVLRIREEDSVGRCDAVFVPAAASDRSADVLRAAADKPILTVGESPDFLAKGGMINFVLDNERVRFDIDVGAASASGLAISSRLLRVARQALDGSRKVDR